MHDVKMRIKHDQRRKGEKSTATGKAEGIVDCAADRVAAWFFEYCSNERMQNCIEERDSIHVELSGNDKRMPNEKIFAMVERFPFPLSNREFVFRHVWKVNEGSAIVGIWPSDDTVDYGKSVGKTVRGTMKGLFTATNIGCKGKVNQCEVRYYTVSL